MMVSLNARFVWRCYILGCILLPNLVMSSRYLPTRRSIPTQLERNERLKELFEHILESERDAHLSAASKYADQLNLIQKKSIDLYPMPEHMDSNYEKWTVRDFGDDSNDIDYQERPEYETNRKQTHFHHRQPQQQPWRIELQNYARNMHRGNLLNSNSNLNDGYARNDGSLSSGIASSSSSPSSSSSNQPRSHSLLQKIQNANEHSSSVTNGNSDTNANFNFDLTNNDLDWLASNSDSHSMNDYDALYDDVNENKRSSSSSINRKFDHYRLSGTKQRGNKELSQPKIHLN